MKHNLLAGLRLGDHPGRFASHALGKARSTETERLEEGNMMRKRVWTILRTSEGGLSMKPFTWIAAIIFLGVATTGCLAPAALAHGCAMSDVAATYGYTSTGTIVTPPVGPFLAVGRITFSNTGTLSGKQTTSIAGNFFDETVSGTYTVNPDCTGTATANVYHGSTLVRTTNLSIVWVDDQKEARAIFLTAGTAISINARKISSD